MNGTDVLDQLGTVPRSELAAAIEQHEPEVIVQALAAAFAERVDAKALAKAGVVVHYLCHTSDASASAFIEWTKSGATVAASYAGERRPARMEWQRLSDAVDYELGRITLQGVALVERFSMSATSAEIRAIFDGESRKGDLIRGLRDVQEMSDRQREKALRGLDVDQVLLQQQQATNEAIRIFNLLPELEGRVIEWRVGTGDDTHVVQSIYENGDAREVLGETVARDALLHFHRVGDFAQFLNGKTNVPRIAMEGNLTVDGDFHLLEILARIPEPFDPAERWAIDRG
jgi:hypothetical protein